MKPYSDFLFIIQGPLHENGINAYNVYKEYTDNIIYSHWFTDKLTVPKGASEIINMMEFVPHYYNNQNVYYQIFSTERGLSTQGYSPCNGVEPKYCLKLRCDQYFGNLVPILEAIKANPDKFTCSNLHVRPDKLLKFHASDKLFGCGLNIFKPMISTALFRVKYNGVSLLAGAYDYYSEYHKSAVGRGMDIIEYYSYANQDRKMVTQYGEKPLSGTIQV